MDIYVEKLEPILGADNDRQTIHFDQCGVAY